MVICPVCKNKQSFSFITLKVITCEYCKSKFDMKGKLLKKDKEGLKEYENRLYREEYIKEKARLQAQKEHKKK
ncbi:MAG: hypothetical protein Q8P57_02200 [Candidatus Pacearchaeota archaeon]|nr:hypothetical protein [Candidatus Pacearchaeota archaeon]